MLKLEEIKKGARLTGLDPRGIVCVPSVEPLGTDAVTVCFKGGRRQARRADAVPHRRGAPMSARRC